MIKEFKILILLDFLFLKKIIWKSERQTFHPLVYSPNACSRQVWAYPNPGMLASTNNTVKIFMCKFWVLSFLVCIPRNGISGTLFYCVRSYQSVFQNRCTVLSSFEWYVKVPISITANTSFFDPSHPSFCEILFHCSFDFMYMMTLMAFSCAFWNSHISFLKKYLLQLSCKC